MPEKKYIKNIFLFLNLFVPGCANISSRFMLGTAFIVTSILLFFATPYLSIDFIRLAYFLLLAVSYITYFKSGKNEEKPPLLKCTLLSLLLFIALSFSSIIFTHKLKTDNSTIKKGDVVFVLGTKPFKKDSTEKMLNMSNEELFNMFNNDIHPFFRRLKAGLKKVGNSGAILMISAGKNQKRITKKILNHENKKALFYSCKSTKEELFTLNRFLKVRKAKGRPSPGSITIVSDDYHAFRALLYSKYYNIHDVSFLSTSYKYSFVGFIKIYLVEQIVFLLSYLSFFVNLIGIVF